MLEVRLLHKPGCHLCEMAERDLASLQRRYPHRLSLVDISRDPLLLARYGERIPVVQVGDREYGAPLPRAALERALRAAGNA